MLNGSNLIKLILLPLIALILYPTNIIADFIDCNSDNFDNFIEAENIKFIDITVIKMKEWQLNFHNAFIEKKDISEKYKRKFNAHLKVRFDNELECIFPAKIRISGDQIDHLGITPKASIPYGISSLDVKLIAGNINSVTKFKLFIPITKGGNNEVFSTALLTELGFLAPKTYHVPGAINGQETIYLFQEKITKEFIESNDFTEAPLLEGDERFLFNNDLVNFDRFGLARILNNKWTEKGYTSLNISKTALKQLNKAYFEYLTERHRYGNNNKRFLNPNDFLDDNSIVKDRGFSAILIAIGASHGLRPHNRSFYYDPIYKYFRPIYYDGNSTITNPHSLVDEYMWYGKYLSRAERIESSFALKSFENFSSIHFHSRLKGLGLDYSLEEVELLVDKIKTNLLKIQNTKYNKIDHGAFFSMNQERTYEPYFSKVFKYIEEGARSKRLVFSTDQLPSSLERNSSVEICDLSLTSCKYDVLSIKEYSKLLKGRLSDDYGNAYIFIGNKQEYLAGINAKSNKEQKVFNLEEGVKLVVYGSPKTRIDKKGKNVELIQNNITDRFLIFGGELKDWNIKFIGHKDGKINNGQNFNQNLLTGCLTLLDLNVDNISIEIDGAMCEDGVNFVRVIGEIDNVVAKNVLSDSIDADFSKLNFANINIKNAGNDCIDLSYGNYHIEYADLFDCKDKAISVGEKSRLAIGLAKVSKANIGIAAKDSSVVKVNSIDTTSTIICFSAFNKKQEFWGGKITVNKHNCLPKQVFQEKKSLVEYIL